MEKIPHHSYLHRLNKKENDELTGVFTGEYDDLIPPPPPARAFAMFTLMRLPSNSCSFRPLIAVSASCEEPKVTKPNPRERPVSRSLMTMDCTHAKPFAKGIIDDMKHRDRITARSRSSKGKAKGQVKFQRQREQQAHIKDTSEL